MTKCLYPYLYVTDDDFLNWCTTLLNIKFHSKKNKETKKKKKSEQRNKPLLFRNKKVTTCIYDCYEKLCENNFIYNIRPLAFIIFIPLHIQLYYRKNIFHSAISHVTDHAMFMFML